MKGSQEKKGGEQLPHSDCVLDSDFVTANSTSSANQMGHASSQHTGYECVWICMVRAGHRAVNCLVHIQISVEEG